MIFELSANLNFIIDREICGIANFAAQHEFGSAHFMPTDITKYVNCSLLLFAVHLLSRF